MAEYIFLDSDYADFVPQQSKIKLDTLINNTGCLGYLIVVVFIMTLPMTMGLILQNFAPFVEFQQQGVVAKATITSCEEYREKAQRRRYFIHILFMIRFIMPPIRLVQRTHAGIFLRELSFRFNIWRMSQNGRSI